MSFKPTDNVLIAESGRRGRGAEISQLILLQDFFSRRALRDDDDDAKERQ